MSLERIVIVGASLAGLRAAETLRREGYDGQLALVGAEPELPYDRPPLSKQILRGEWDAERLALRRQPYDALDLALHLGRRATHLDVAGRSVSLDDDSVLSYDGLVIATGAAPRSLPDAAPLAGVHVLRTLADALAIRAELDAQPRRVVVVGGGFIGAEVAASCRARALEVTVIEPLAAPMLRGLGPETGAWMADVHRDQGVDLRLGLGVEKLIGGTRVEAVRLSDASEVVADVVVVGIGVSPATGWLESSSLRLEDGVVCDPTCAAAPGIVAAGDVARWTNPLFGEGMRIEHWTNAVEQGVAAAQRLLHGEGVPPFAPVPLVWTDQFDLKLQFAGLPHFAGESHIVHGSLDERRFTQILEREGRLIGAIAVNQPRILMQYRRLIGEGASFETALAHAATLA